MENLDLILLSSQTYIGRFAPSPTGPLHFGSLLAAVASYLEAKSQKGLWLVRMEDLDKPREIKGAADQILRTLEAFGFEWAGEIMYQSQRSDAYAQALESLKTKKLSYPCTCTRKEIADSANMLGVDGVIYPKTCLNQPIKQNKALAWRLLTDNTTISFTDAIQGNISQNLGEQVGDFIVKRADALYAYQLAVVVDDAAQGVTHIVRGADLLDSTPRQIYLQQVLNLAPIEYAHIPVASNVAGEKLSKQTLALALDLNDASNLIWHALAFLGQLPPTDLKNSTLQEIWQWATEHWDLTKTPQQHHIVSPI